MKIKLPIILSLLAFFSLAATVSAQELVRTFTISPPAVQVNLDPGARVEGTLKLVNDGNDPLSFQTSVQDFTVKDDEGTPNILPPNTLSNKYSGASWVAIYPDVISVAPHQKAELSYFIQVPLDARPGGHYAAVMYTPTTNVGVNGNGTSVNTSVGTLFYITVKGPVNIKAQITKFLTKSLWDLGPVTVNTSVKNLSDVHVTPRGTITLTNMLGQKSDQKDLASYNIFPGVSRNYQTKLGKTFMLGFYKADLKASYGPNNAPLVSSASFIVFPWKLAAFVVLMVIVLVVGYKYWKGDIKLSRREEEPKGPPITNS
jgi:hypothetical protein